ncbi:hypothetical protein BIY29_17675 [Brenneria alni]|uniref:Uncharacterized protein n=2 Tax=Brenneria alni TaxID=71656 RepID=A0A421DJU3_9GAMM|nr:hypothetical protein BIY29_17675 [Brenneria alni]
MMNATIMTATTMKNMTNLLLICMLRIFWASILVQNCWLSHSQGDGVVFYGSLHAGEMVELFAALVRQGYLTNREASAFTKLVVHYDMTLRLTRNDFGQHYAHANCINIDFYDIDVPDRYPHCCQRIFTAVKQSVHAICGMAESQGYDLLDALH